MTNKDKIKYLLQYKKTEKEMQILKRSIESHYYKMYKINISKLSHTPQSGTGYVNNTIANNIADYEALKEVYEQKIKKLNDLRINIQNSIWDLKESQQRMLMTLRYIDGKKWEEICILIGYSWGQTHRIHSKSLSMLKIE